MIFGVEVGLAGVFGLEVGLPKAKERACSRLLQKLVLRDPKATLDIWACTGSSIFGRFLVSELDGGKARRSRLPGALEGGDEPGVEGMNCFWRIFGVEVGLAGGCITTFFERC